MGTRVLDDGSEQYQTRGGITVTRARRETSYADAIDSYIERLDERRGAVFSSNYEYPGRYTRWDVAIADPPIGITSFGRALWIEAYNARGEVLLDIITEHLKSVDDLTLGAKTTTRLDLTVNKPDRVFTEEERSKIPTVFSVLRAITDLFHSPEDAQIGLYGAFGYDLAFQFDAIELKLKRPVTSATWCCSCPTKSSWSTIIPPRPGSIATISKKPERRRSARRARLLPIRSIPPMRSRHAAIIALANMPSWLPRPRKVSDVATCSRSFRARNSWSAAIPSRRIFPAG